MSDPTLTSDTPGAIVVSWEIPSPEPSDYRIDWAKSGEDYTSWRVDEGHVYPAGTETTVTIEGLEAGVEYKVRMRARYHAGDPWSGPWTGDVLIVVAAEGGSIVEVIEPDDTEEPRIAAEQNSPEVLVSNLNLSGGRVTLLLQDSGGVRQSFTTGPNPAGYQISSITLRMRAAFTVNLPGTFNPTVSVIPELSEVAEFTFTAPDGFSGNQRHVFQEATFTAPEDAVLDPNTTYRLQVTNSQSSLNIDNASGDAEESDHGWLIANGLRIIGESLPQGVSVLMAISGEPIPETLISNLKKTAASSATVSTASRAAQSFTTGPGLLGFGYRFDGISVAANLETAGESPSPQMSLYTDENGNPGARLFSLTPPSDFASTATETEYTLTAPSNATLDPGSRYWVVFSNTATDNYQVSTTNDDGEDQDPTPQPGFSIGDGHQTSTGSPPTWADQSQSIRLTVLGGPAWVTDEPADGDFPGSPRTGHRTNGVVSVGTNSAGHLTAGQDIRRLNTGDYWLLDTQPGRSYRLEVTMGTVASQGTGGSAWIEFIDPGDTTTSTCCESDHNRDDSYITVHFEHYQYSPGRRYFVNVTAYDKLAGFGRNSAVYNGPLHHHPRGHHRCGDGRLQPPPRHNHAYRRYRPGRQLAVRAVHGRHPRRRLQARPRRHTRLPLNSQP